MLFLTVSYLYVESALWEREGGPIAFLPARDHQWRAGESGRVRQGAEATVSVLNRKLHNICSLALREGVDSQLCVFQNVMCFDLSRTCMQTGLVTHFSPKFSQSQSDCLQSLKVSISLN